jgi:hypothetical protein
MKTPNKLSFKKNSKKFNYFQKFIVFLGFMIVAFTILPAVIVLFLGLLPTLTIVVTNTKNINKITTVGCFNIAGVMICLNNLFKQFNSGIDFSIRENIFNIIIMLASAALGVFLYYILPDIFAYIFKNSAQHRLKNINAKLEKLTQTWANIIPENH